MDKIYNSALLETYYNFLEKLNYLSEDSLENSINNKKKQAKSFFQKILKKYKTQINGFDEEINGDEPLKKELIKEITNTEDIPIFNLNQYREAIREKTLKDIKSKKETNVGTSIDSVNTIKKLRKNDNSYGINIFSSPGLEKDIFSMFHQNDKKIIFEKAMHTTIEKLRKNDNSDEVHILPYSQKTILGINNNQMEDTVHYFNIYEDLSNKISSSFTENHKKSLDSLENIIEYIYKKDDVVLSGELIKELYQMLNLISIGKSNKRALDILQQLESKN